MTWSRGRNLSGISDKQKKLSFVYDSNGNLLSKTEAIKGGEKTVTEYIINGCTVLAEICRDEKGNVNHILNYSYNLYAYCGGDSVNKDDKSGNVANILIGAGIGAITGLLGQVVTDAINSSLQGKLQI